VEDCHGIQRRISRDCRRRRSGVQPFDCDSWPIRAASANARGAAGFTFGGSECDGLIVAKRCSDLPTALEPL